MSKLAHHPHAQGRLGQRKPPRRRTYVLAGLAAAVIVTLAYIDGGEEPIRPIVETVELPETGAEAG